MKMESSSSMMFQLSRGKDLALDDDVGCTVGCQSGCLWITEENLGWDFFLHPGHSFTIDQPGRSLITALDHSTFSISDHKTTSTQHATFGIGPIKNFFAAP